MGMQDLQTLMSDKQSVAAVASTLISTNIIDLGAVGTVPPGFQTRGAARHDLGGGGKPCHLLVTVTTTVTSGGAATIEAQFCQSDNADLSSPEVLQSSGAIALATMIAGYQFRLETPVGVTKRYVGMQYVIGTATTTAGKITAGLNMDKQTVHA